jgi:hypothetical protein
MTRVCHTYIDTLAIYELDISRNHYFFNLRASKSAYETLFIGAVHFEPWELIWKSWAPKKCQFFIWLAVHKRCWTADRLARRELPHPTCCVLCDQVEEDIQHILVGCVFAKQVWFQMLSKVGLSALAPQATDTSFEDWWIKVSSERESTP